MWLRLTAQGPAGHAAVPPDATAVTHLTAALSKLIAYRPTVQVIDTVRDYFRAVAKLERDGTATWNCTDFGHTTFPGRRHIYFMDPEGNSIELVTLLPTDRGAQLAEA